MDSSETLPATQAEHQLPATSPAASMFQQLMERSTDPNFDAGKMEQMVKLALEVRNDNQQQEFNRAMHDAILEMPVITKDGRIVIKDKHTGAVTQSTPFAKYEDIDRVVRPIAARHGLSYTFDPGGDATRLTCACIIRHRNGHVQRGGDMPLPLETSGSKNNVQGVGSSMTYGKRYTLILAFSIRVEGQDDDGSGGVKPVSLPFERENAVLTEAEEAFGQGRYDEWYRGQSVRDRAWLVQHGHHTRFGGTPPPAALTGPTQDESPISTLTQDESAKPKRGALDERVEQYERDVAACQTLDDLQKLQVDRTEWASKVRERRPDLADRITEANAARYQELTGTDESGVTGDDLFPGDPD